MNLPVVITKDQTPKEPKTYRIGQTFKHKSESDGIYQLQVVKSNPACVQLSRINDGARWSGAFEVVNIEEITESEFLRITTRDKSEFTPVEIQITEL
jgi:hypothetical protein